MLFKASYESLQPLAKIRAAMARLNDQESVPGNSHIGCPMVTFGIFTASQFVDLRPGLNFVHAFHT